MRSISPSKVRGCQLCKVRHGGTYCRDRRCRLVGDGQNSSWCSTKPRKNIRLASSYVKTETCGITTFHSGYLRNFRDSNWKIYGFVKSNPARGVFATTPKNLMVEKDLYALLGESGPTRQAVEECFSRHEDREKAIAEKIITAARNNAPPRLTPEEKSICHHLHYRTWVRTPDIAAEKDEHMEPFNIDAFLEWYRKERNLDAHDMAIAQAFLRDSDNQKVADHDSHVMTVASPPTLDVIKNLQAHGLKIARIPRPNKSFVIGSYALAPVRHRREGHGVWLPISHDVAVTPFGPPWKEELVELTQDDDIRAINEASFRRNSIVAARSKQLLRSLANGLGYHPG